MNDLDQILQSGSIPYSYRDLGPIEIGSKTDAVLTHMFENVLEVFDHQINGRICILTTVWAEIASGEVDADHAPGFTDRSQLLVSEISRMWAQSMRIGMRSDEGRIADSGNVPESAFVEVRQVDQNLQAVASPDQLLAKVRQTGSRSGEEGQRNGTPCANAFDRLQTGPRERSPASYNTSRSSKFGSIASAPSI